MPCKKSRPTASSRWPTRCRCKTSSGDDVPTPSLSVAEALANAPSRQGSHFGVPAVFDSDEPVSH